MYKFGLVCFVLAASVVLKNDAAQLTASQKSKIYGSVLSAGMECMRDFPLSLDHIQAFRNKKAPNDEVAKCFTHCLYKKLGLMDDSGKISEKTAKAATKKVFKEGDEMFTKVEELISRCIHVNDAETSDGDKGCDRAKLAFECFIEHAKELDLDVDL
uniref:Odorant-binding protein 17 n=2 Tax=Ectropis TaxID=248898 RepID=A0A1L2BLA7_ECTOB|nr:odorant-binding protein 17 [Ectropis obliqua]